MKLVLIRTEPSAAATVGRLVTPQISALWTIELPWRDNWIDQSCVPEGDYELFPYVSPKHGQTWQLHAPALNVFAGTPPPGGRSAVEIHAANFARELEGCIAVGLAGEPMFDPVANAVVPAVQDSLAAVVQLRALLGTDSGHTLTITGTQL